MLNSPRLHAIDNLRVAVFIILMFYHLGMFYVAEWGWHVKSAITYDWLQLPMLWSNQWRMSVLFLIAGISLRLSLSARSSGQVVSSRVVFLGIPLLAGMAVWIVPQVYIELHDKQLLQGITIVEFVWRYWHPTLMLPSGYSHFPNLTWTWNHLWFLPYLLTYTVVAVLFIGIVRALGLKDHFLPFVLPNLVIGLLLWLLPVLMYTFIGYWLFSAYPVTYGFINDWFNHANYGFTFLIGMLLALNQRFYFCVQQYLGLYLLAAIINFLIIFFVFCNEASAWPNVMQSLVWSSNRWLWQLVALGLVLNFWHKSSTWVSFFKPRLFCYYIVHQTALIMGIFFMIDAVNLIWQPLVLLLFTVLICEMSFRLAKRYTILAYALGVKNRAIPLKL